MPITPAQTKAAAAIQNAAAHATESQVRLVAGPGTGKSASIEERICWLLGKSVSPKSIYVVSFTRASAADLRKRIKQKCDKLGLDQDGGIRVSTLHSLALRILKKDGQLETYPSDPMVLDNWELENVFDEEFGTIHGVGKKRREQIRAEHEAFWSTGSWDPANYVPPEEPITQEERGHFEAFHTPRTQTYSCVLPGEIVRLCVDRMEAGLLNAVALLKMKHLIVDEFQDLNPADLKFVDYVINQGATVFVAGDDDQSVYSFRYASPIGIQKFDENYPDAALHQLKHCFRCTPKVLKASLSLMAANPGTNRIPKAHVSLYESSLPPVEGTVHRWRFTSDKNEAKAIAASCKSLIDAGIPHRDILILLFNKRVLANLIIDELTNAGVDAEHPNEESFLDSDVGHLVLAILRIVSNPEDYISHRVILGQRKGIGIGKCIAVFDAVLENSLNYRDIFYKPLPSAIKGPVLKTIGLARDSCAIISGWDKEDTIGDRVDAISQIIENHYSADAVDSWTDFVESLPEGMTLEELLGYLWTDMDEQQEKIMKDVYERLELDIPAAGLLPPKVRVMTMHGAKGLSSQVVFIPGLEEEIIPGKWRQPYPGLVMEAARLLYVSITRARASCVISLARRRTINGKSQVHPASRFAMNLAGAFSDRACGFDADEVRAIKKHCKNLF